MSRTNYGHQKGFTIVELLVVIVVIGILAAISIVAFNGVQRQARVTVVKSDLQGASTQLKIDNISKGSFPATTAAANDNAGLVTSPGTTYQYTVDNAANPPTFCLTATNGDISYYITQDSAPKEGLCPGHSTPVAENQGNVTTIAGTGSIINLYPNDVALDSAGTLYIADSNNVMRRLVAGGSVTLFLGSPGSPGVSNGTGAPGGGGATFTNPAAVAIGADGLMYIVDNGSNNNRLRKVTTDVIVSSLAGNGTGYVEGTGAGARFTGPAGVAVDTDGTIYVSDTGNFKIRKVTPAGLTTLFAGSTSGSTNANGASAQFAAPNGIAIDANHNVYVADTNNHRIRKITPSGDVTTFAGSTNGYLDANGTSAQFSGPYGIEFDLSGNLLVSDTGNHRIRKITPSGDVTTIAGSTSGYLDGAGTAARFNGPRGLTVGPDGAIYVADTNNYRIRKIQ